MLCIVYVMWYIQQRDNASSVPSTEYQTNVMNYNNVQIMLKLIWNNNNNKSCVWTERIYGEFDGIDTPLMCAFDVSVCVCVCIENRIVIDEYS